MSEPVIDLGEDRDHSYDRASAPQWTSRGRRVGSLLIVLAFAGGTLAGATRAPAPSLTLIARVADPADRSSVQLVDGAFVKRERDDLVVVGPDGDERWRLESASASTSAVEADDGLLIFSGRESPGGAFVEAFNLETGEHRWRLDGWSDVVGDFITNRGGDVVRVYRKSDLLPLWTAKRVHAFTVDTERQTLLSLSSDGRLTEYELPTGDRVRSALIPEIAHSEQMIIWSGADHVMVGGTDGAERKLSWIYLARDTFARIPKHEARWWESYGCGPVTCMRETPPSRVSVIDSATGAILWQASSARAVVGAGSELVIVHSQWEPERRLAGRFDPLTGERIEPMFGWFALVGEEFKATPLVLKPSAGRTEVGLLMSGGLRLLGEIPGELRDCEYEAHLLACRAPGGLTEVWRVDF